MKISIKFSDIDIIDVKATNAAFVEAMNQDFKKKKQEAVKKAMDSGTMLKRNPNVKYYFAKNLEEFHAGLSLLKEKEKLKKDMLLLTKAEKKMLKPDMKVIETKLSNFETINFPFFRKNHRAHTRTGAIRIHSGLVDTYRDTPTHKIPKNDRAIVVTVEEAFEAMITIWGHHETDCPTIHEDKLFKLIDGTRQYGMTRDMCSVFVECISNSVSLHYKNGSPLLDDGLDHSDGMGGLPVVQLDGTNDVPFVHQDGTDVNQGDSSETHAVLSNDTENPNGTTTVEEKSPVVKESKGPSESELVVSNDGNNSIVVSLGKPMNDKIVKEASGDESKFAKSSNNDEEVKDDSGSFCKESSSSSEEPPSANEKEEELDEKDEESISKALGLFKNEMDAGLCQKKFYHIMIDLVNVQWNNSKEKYFDKAPYDYVLVVYCMVTGYVLFRKIHIPTSFGEIGEILSIIFSDFGYPRTVQYCRRGISFNHDRYLHQNAISPGAITGFDRSKPFGFFENEKKPVDFLLNVHENIFGTTVLSKKTSHYVDISNRFIACCVDENSILDDVLKTLVDKFISFVNSSSVGKQYPVSRIYPSAQHYVNAMWNSFYGPAEKCVFPLDGKNQSPFERMFHRCSFHHSNVNTEFGVINLWMGGTEFMNSENNCSGFFDQTNERGESIDFQEYGYGSISENVKKMFSFKSAEQSYYPPIYLPQSVGTRRISMVLENNSERLKRIMSVKEKKEFPVGIQNVRRSCQTNAVFRLMQDIPGLNSLLNRSLETMKENPRNLDLYPTILAYMFCGRKLYEKSLERNVSPKQKFIDISVLSLALENKVTKTSNSRNDLLDYSKDECAGHVLRVLLRFLSEELSSLSSELGNDFNALFKKATYMNYFCRSCVNNWITFNDRSMDCFTVQVYLPKDIDQYKSDFVHNPQMNQQYEIHLQDAIRLCSNNWNQPIVGMECGARQTYKQVAIRSDVQSMNHCKVIQSKVYRENPPYIVIEILRSEIISHDFDGTKTFQTTVNETSVYIPKTMLFQINQNASLPAFKKYRFQSAVCVDTIDKNNAHYYVMKPQPGSKYLKMSDKEMTLVDKTKGIHVVQKHACIVMYERDEKSTNPSPSVKSSEFVYSSLVKDFESVIQSTQRASHKRKLRSSSREARETPPKSQKMNHSDNGSPGIEQYLTGKKFNTNEENVNTKDFFEEESHKNDNTESISVSDSDSSYVKTCIYHTTPNGLEEYSILEDDCTFFEQKCVYCLEKTPQFFGKVTFICEKCGSKDKSTSKLNTKQLEKNINKIGISSLYDHCVGCQSKFCGNDIKVYHNLGEFKYCVECISTNACRCFICAKGTDFIYSDKVNTLRALYLLKVSRLENKAKSIKAEIVNTFLVRDRTVDELCICDNMKSQRGEYIVNHGGQLLLNKFFQKYFYQSTESLMPWEIVQYYANLCRDSSMAKKNSVIVQYTVNPPIKEVEELLKKPKFGTYLFVGRGGEDKWHGYEVNLTKKNEVKIVYFDTSERNRESAPFITAKANSFFSDDPRITVLVDGDWKYKNGGYKENQCSFQRNSALYMIFFLMSRCGNLDTKFDVSKLQAMRHHLLLALVTGEPFYF